MQLSQKCYQYCLDVGFKKHVWNKKKIYNLTYHKLRKEYPTLPSIIVSNSVNCACATLKSNKCKYQSNAKTLFLLFCRSFRYKNNIASFPSTQGRIKISIKFPLHAEKFKDWLCKACTLCLRKTN